MPSLFGNVRQLGFISRDLDRSIRQLRTRESELTPMEKEVLFKAKSEDAVQRNRDIMGATNPENAEPGTIRKELAESIEANTVHGSDSDENAAIEIAQFFSGNEIVG